MNEYNLRYRSMLTSQKRHENATSVQIIVTKAPRDRHELTPGQKQIFVQRMLGTIHKVIQRAIATKSHSVAFPRVTQIMPDGGKVFVPNQMTVPWACLVTGMGAFDFGRRFEKGANTTCRVSKTCHVRVARSRSSQHCGYLSPTYAEHDMSTPTREHLAPKLRYTRP